jgi:multidrug efflux system membrane fusion protein
MIAISFLAEWALRSSALILSGALVLWALRVKDPSTRLAASTVLLIASLALPGLTSVLPKMPVAVQSAAVQPVEVPAAAIAVDTPVTRPATVEREPRHVDWAGIAVIVYGAIAMGFLLRLCLGLAMSLRLRRRCRATGEMSDGIAVFESDAVKAPVTLGIVRPVIMLPVGWREWNQQKLDAVLAHERSHIRRFDPAVQLVSAIHRALLWHSPMSWYLHTRIVRVAEEASDDAALAVTQDRPLYAEVLLEFMRVGVRGADRLGVPMARYGRLEARIQRILDGVSLSRGVTRWSAAAILIVAVPLVYAVAAAGPRSEPQAAVKPAAVQAPAVPARPAQAATPQPKPAPTHSYVTGLGNAAPFYTATVKSRIEGQLKSVEFKEGQLVHEGDLLATVEASPAWQMQVAEAERQVVSDQVRLHEANLRPRAEQDQIEDQIKADQVRLDMAKLQLSYASIRAPITGVTGLRQVDPGNIVKPGDANGIVVITQIQPIAVLFTLPEDHVSAVLARLREGKAPVVEAWNRANSVKIASGTLVAIDNQIDPQTGTAKLKAVFENKDGALFPSQFVNVRLFLNQ